MGSQSSKNIQRQATDLLIESVTTTAFTSAQTFSGLNSINIKGCKNVDLSDIIQSTEAFVNLESIQKATQAATQKVNLEQIVQQQADLIAQSISLSKVEMKSVSENLLKLNQSALTAISASCTQNSLAVNAVNLEDCEFIRMKLVKQTNVIKSIANCVQDAVQSSEQFTELKQLMDQKTKVEVKDSFKSIALIIFAIAAVLLVVLIMYIYMRKG